MPFIHPKLPINAAMLVSPPLPGAQMTDGSLPDSQRVTPVQDVKQTTAQFTDRPDGEPDPKTHVAPPSLMQLRIDAMIEEQQSEEAADPAQPAASDPMDRPSAAMESSATRS